ncbi:MAG TPA: hypothetical protein VEK11_26380 [Thermoanaerobaculia bacterium]|nr:hypothetical protein [Thermoanaerobaculia bacterium]
MTSVSDSDSAQLLSTPEEQVNYCLAVILTATAALLEVADEPTIVLPTGLVKAVVTTLRLVTGKLLRFTPDWRGYERDPELNAVLRAIAEQLEGAENFRGPTRDAAYVTVEAFAAPFALALYHEVIILENTLAAP